MWIDDEAAYPNSWKIRSTMDRTMSRDLLLNIGALYIYGTAEDTEFKFGVRIDDEESS